jgi:hypothetical protein
LQCFAYIFADVTYFAGNLSNATGNWHVHVHTQANARVSLFYPY